MSHGTVQGVTEQTISGDLVRIRGTNSTDASFPTRIPTVTEPSGLGNAAAQTTSAVVDLRKGVSSGAAVSTRWMIVPYGAGSDTNTFLVRVIGWRKARFRPGDATTEPREVWVPVTLAQFTCTLSTPVGIAGRSVIETDRFCDTITRTIGSDSSSEVISPANDTIAHAVVDLKGFEKMEITFDRNSSATSCNALISPY